MNRTFDKFTFMNEVILGDKVLLKQLVTLFLRKYPEGMDGMERALAGKDLREIEHAAHSLKNLVGNFFANKALELSERLETGVRGGSLEGADDIWHQLKPEMHLLRDDLKKLLEDNSGTDA